jgi:hypothetical protein
MHLDWIEIWTVSSPCDKYTWLKSTYSFIQISPNYFSSLFPHLWFFFRELKNRTDSTFAYKYKNSYNR